jgi:hypothetical protein
MTFKERMAVIEKIVKRERILFGVQFPACGSLFFKDSLDAEVKIRAKTFTIRTIKHSFQNTRIWPVSFTAVRRS